MNTRRLVAVIIIIVLLLSPVVLIIYSGTWPPIYTVESESMEHSADWTYGNINVGDLVFVKNVNGNVNNVVTFVQGKGTGYSTYGEYGNVILYKAPTNEIIIHRAMFYLSWLDGKPVVSGYTNQSWIKVTSSYVVIDNASYTQRNLIVYLNNLVNKTGFITVGDYNLAHSQLFNRSEDAYAAADQNVFGYNPVSSNEILGVAFGQVPWFGLIKLNLMRITGQWTQYDQVPNFAYVYLFVTILSIVVLVLFPYDRFKGNRNK